MFHQRHGERGGKPFPACQLAQHGTAPIARQVQTVNGEFPQRGAADDAFTGGKLVANKLFIGNPDKVDNLLYLRRGVFPAEDGGGCGQFGRREAQQFLLHRALMPDGRDECG